MNLDNQNVLLIAPRFFGYEADIMGELSKRGANVDFLADRPFATSWGKAAAKYFPVCSAKLATALYRRQLLNYGRSKYSLILIINGQTLDTEFALELRSNFPSAKFLHYVWDSLSNRKSIVRLLKYVDSSFTFDHSDAKRFGMNFRPLFYGKNFNNVTESRTQYDISFVGTAHGDRVKVVRSLDSTLPKETKRYWYLYLQAKWVFHANRITNPAFKNVKSTDFRFYPLPKPQLQQVFSRSNAILDIEHRKQSGLTMRTFETVGTRKKLITTNTDIASYDFYDPNNIAIINRENPIIRDDFLMQPYKDLPDGLYQKYSISGWMDEILDAL